MKYYTFVAIGLDNEEFIADPAIGGLNSSRDGSQIAVI